MKAEPRLRDLAVRYTEATGCAAVSSYGKGSGLFVRGVGWVPEAEAERHIVDMMAMVAWCKAHPQGATA